MSRNKTAKIEGFWRQPSIFVILISGTITIFFLIAIGRELFRNQTVHRQLSTLREQVTQETKRQKELQDLLTYLSSPTFQERQARLQLGLKGEGEKVIIVPDNTVNSVTGTTNTGTTDAGGNNQTNPEKWWAYFFGS